MGFVGEVCGGPIRDTPVAPGFEDGLLGGAILGRGGGEVWGLTPGLRFGPLAGLGGGGSFLVGRSARLCVFLGIPDPIPGSIGSGADPTF